MAPEMSLSSKSGPAVEMEALRVEPREWISSRNGDLARSAVATVAIKRQAPEKVKETKRTDGGAPFGQWRTPDGLLVRPNFDHVLN